MTPAVPGSDIATAEVIHKTKAADVFEGSALLE
jgi:hypothetical protein